MSVMRSRGGDGVVRCGHLKKLKTLRRKFFVLRADTADAAARLEYYDSERKYSSGQPPKRSIPLRSCFNINRRLDTKHKHVIALYTKDDCFCVVLDSEEDADAWLQALLRLQHGEEVVDGEAPKPTFEHVWQVTVCNRGLGKAGLTGHYRLCLTDKTLSLINRECQKILELNLTNIRTCGNLRDFLFLEVGRSSTVGAGELWLQTEDSNIAQNVHSTVFHAMSTISKEGKEDVTPEGRNRSSSATESSKPSMTRKVHNAPPKCHLFTQDVAPGDNAGTSTQHPIVSGVASFYQHLIQRGAAKAAERRHSISAGSVTQCGTISHQRTQSLPLANPAPSDQNTHPLRVAKRSNNPSKCLGGGRERCDSMPSRARTTSEGTHNHPWNQTRPHLINHYRPASLYGRDISHSPPSGSPVSPPSVGCSTDSAGSSYSLTDETDVCTELDPSLGRYGHSLTPDEAIAEEECVDGPYSHYVAMRGSDEYVDMSPRGKHNSPTASMSSVTSGTPSTDMRFAEYPLEKVSSYLASEEDDARPTRAYSVGSKPESYKKYELGQNNENLRVRALSVGSKQKKLPGRVRPPHGYHVHQGAKSSSAPILSNARGQGSHGSIGPMDDLMEMDFSRSGSNNSGYMDMRPGPKNHGYVEMKPGGSAPRKPDTSPYVDMSQGSSPAKPSFIPPAQSEDYMEMDPRKSTAHNNNNNDYLAMSFKRPPTTYQMSPSDSSYLGSPKTEPVTPEGYVEMSLGRGHQRQSSLDSVPTNEDYANMSMGKKRERKKKEKTRSQPIAIQNPGNAQKGGASSPRYALLGRKFSSGTPPMHLPLDSRRRQDSTSSSTVTTPSSSSTIFPFSPQTPPTAKKTDDYTPMDFDQSDYVNYNPKVDESSRLAMMQINDSASFRPIDESDAGAYEVLRARPSSTSSELCSSSSTIVGSRPESVNSDRVRPSSVSSADVQLHYASLDLEDGNRSPRTVKGGEGGGAEVTLTYAAIDFVKSEGLKHNSMNAKVKH